MYLRVKLSFVVRFALGFILLTGLFAARTADQAFAASEAGQPASVGDKNSSNILSVANLQAQTGFPATTVLDNFDRANGALGSNWGGQTSGYAIAGNGLDINSGQDIYWTPASFGANQEAYVRLTTIDTNAEEISLILKAQSNSSINPAELVVVYHPAGNSVQIWTYSTAQGWVAQGTPIAATYANGDQFGARAQANGQVDVYKNGALLGSRTITGWPYSSLGGYIGLFQVNAGANLLDDFGGGTLSGLPTPTPTAPPCTDPTACNPVHSVPALWRCNIAGCTTPDWIGSVVAWPSWSAHQSNARTGDNSRSVHSPGGQALHPYMGAWADGCQVTAVTGLTMIIEWRRGTDTWRQTLLEPGQSHTIDLVSPEDGALIESPDTPTSFSVSLANCTPQNIFGPTPTASTTPSQAPSNTPTLTFTPSITPTATLAPSNTPTATFTSSPTPTSTFTPSSTPTATFTPSNTPTSAPGSTPTHTPTFTPTPSRTPTATFTQTSTPTATFTSTPSNGFPATQVLDTFNRANGGIGSSWSGFGSAYSISTNRLDVTSGGYDTYILWNASSFGADQEAYVTLTQLDASSGNEHGLILKSQSSSSDGGGLIDVLYDHASGVVQVWTYHPTQSWVKHGANVPVTFVSGDRFGARARPDGTVEIYRNGSLLGTRSITAWPHYATGGYVGLWLANAGAAVADDFGGGTR